MTSAITQFPAPSQRPGRTRRLAAAPPAITAVGASLAAVAAATAFIPWGHRYEAISYQAIETSASARYPHGFLITGALEGAVLVIMTATALLAAAAAVTGSRIHTTRTGRLAFSGAAALLAATVLPAAVLDGYLAAVPAIAAIAAVVFAGPGRPGTATMKTGELIGWAAGIAAAGALFSGLGVIVAVVLALSRFRRMSSTARWGIVLFALFIAMIHVLAVSGGLLL